MNLLTLREERLKAENLKIVKWLQEDLYYDSINKVLFPHHRLFRTDNDINVNDIKELEDDLRSKVMSIPYPNDNTLGSFYMILSILNSKFIDEQDNVCKHIVPLLDEIITKEINDIVRYCGGITVRIDSFSEDWEALFTSLMHNHKIYGTLELEFNQLAEKYLKLLPNITEYITIAKMDNGNAKVMTLHIPGDVVFRKTFLYPGYNQPGIFIINPKDSKYDRLASIVNETKLTVFDIFLKNPHRDSGCVKVWFNKITNQFTVSI